MASTQTKSEKKRNAQQALEIGAGIRAHRQRLGLTQRALGLRLSTRNNKPVSESQVSAWERGEQAPEPRRRQEVADALQTTIGDIFGEPQDASLVRRLRQVELEIDAIKLLAGLEDAVEAVLRRQRQQARDGGDQRDILERIAKDAPTSTGAGQGDGTGQVRRAARRPK